MIHTSRNGPVTTVTLDRPERRNAVNLETLVELRAAIDQASDDGTRVLVLCGAGGTFCAGADLTGVEGPGFAAALTGVLTGLTELPAVTLAAVQGAALGAGTQLAIACDLRMAAPDAFFGIPASRLGLMVDAWTVQRLALLVGGSVAREMLLAAENLTADHAQALGLVHRTGGVDDALAWADRLAALAPLSVAGHKLALERLSGGTVPAVADADIEAAFRRVWASEDAQEGPAAFLAKRPPAFKGR